jgi:hypothetical protein
LRERADVRGGGSKVSAMAASSCARAVDVS